MTVLNPQSALGGFTLLTLLLAGTAIGHVLRIDPGMALYLTALLLVVVGWLRHRLLLRPVCQSADEPEA